MGAAGRALGVCLSVAIAVAAVANGKAREDASSSDVPEDPVVVAADGGAFAVAVPALSGRPAPAGDAVAFTMEDAAREKLFSIRVAEAGGASRALYTAPRERSGPGSSLGASPTRVVALRERTGRLPVCRAGGACSSPPGAVLAGAVTGSLAPRFGTTERLPAAGSCVRRIAQLDDGGVSLSGEQVAYVRRVRCMRPRRRGHTQVVVRDLGSDTIRVVHHGPARGVQLAGRYLAFEPVGRHAGGLVVVRDLRRRRVAYRANVGWQNHYSLGADGTLVHTMFSERCCAMTGRIGWHSTRSPRLHVLPHRVAGFSGAPLIYAGGRIAYVRRYDYTGESTLSITDLQGRSVDYAQFSAPEELESFAFDGARIAFAHTRFRPDQGDADDGLRAICVDDRILVQATASVIEVHPVTDPGRIPVPALPSAAPYRSPSAERPECPYRD